MFGDKLHTWKQKVRENMFYLQLWQKKPAIQELYMQIKARKLLKTAKIFPFKSITDTLFILVPR